LGRYYFYNNVTGILPKCILNLALVDKGQTFDSVLAGGAFSVDFERELD